MRIATPAIPAVFQSVSHSFCMSHFVTPYEMNKHLLTFKSLFDNFLVHKIDVIFKNAQKQPVDLILFSSSCFLVIMISEDTEFRRILGYVVFIFSGVQDMTPLDYRGTIEENFLLSSTSLVSEIFACQRETE